jgi:hypothetical protein
MFVAAEGVEEALFPLAIPMLFGGTWKLVARDARDALEKKLLQRWFG